MCSYCVGMTVSRSKNIEQIMIFAQYGYRPVISQSVITSLINAFQGWEVLKENKCFFFNNKVIIISDIFKIFNLLCSMRNPITTLTTEHKFYDEIVDGNSTDRYREV